MVSPIKLAERKGLEPSASGVTGRRYNRLNYRSVTWPCGLFAPALRDRKIGFRRNARNTLAEQKGLEPSASGVTGRRYNRLNYCSAWWAVQDLNLWPSACKADALPTELTARFVPAFLGHAALAVNA